jgi:Protein of unknown function (DUF3102)
MSSVCIYSNLAAADADALRQVAARIQIRTRDAIIETGRDLIEAKRRLPPGAFGRWVRSELGMTERTATNYMNAASISAEMADGKPETVSELPAPLPATVLYRLAAAPEPVRAALVRRAAGGELLTAAAVAEARGGARGGRAEGAGGSGGARAPPDKGGPPAAGGGVAPPVRGKKGAPTSGRTRGAGGGGALASPPTGGSTPRGEATARGGGHELRLASRRRGASRHARRSGAGRGRCLRMTSPA